MKRDFEMEADREALLLGNPHLKVYVIRTPTQAFKLYGQIHPIYRTLEHPFH